MKLTTPDRSITASAINYRNGRLLFGFDLDKVRSPGYVFLEIGKGARLEEIHPLVAFRG